MVIFAKLVSQSAPPKVAILLQVPNGEDEACVCVCVCFRSIASTIKQLMLMIPSVIDLL